MKYAISVTDTSRTKEIENNGLKIIDLLKNFSLFLGQITNFDNPRGIVFHDLESATELYSTSPLPAYTSRDLIHITPLVKTWRDLFLSTTKDIDVKKATEYYMSLDLTDIATIAGHELTHQSEFFHDDFDEIDYENTWFEEGMCFYIPRKLIMPENKFNEIMEVESQLIDVYKNKYGEYSLNQFGESGENASENEIYSAAFYDYWRSTKVIRTLVEDYFNHQISDLIKCYRKWVAQDSNPLLQTFFINKLNLTENEAKEMWFKI